MSGLDPLLGNQKKGGRSKWYTERAVAADDGPVVVPFRSVVACVYGKAAFVPFVVVVFGDVKGRERMERAMISK